MEGGMEGGRDAPIAFNHVPLHVANEGAAVSSSLKGIAEESGGTHKRFVIGG